MPTPISISPAQLTQGDQVILRGTFKNRSDGTIIDISGYTITLRYWFNEGPVTAVTATNSDPTNGIAQYQFTGVGLSTSGLLKWEWLVDDGSVEVMSDQVFQAPVRRKR